MPFNKYKSRHHSESSLRRSLLLLYVQWLHAIVNIHFDPKSGLLFFTYIRGHLV